MFSSPDLLWSHLLCSLFQNKLAKALYDNTAECPDELAFRKGDIVMVMDQNVAGTTGWWMCSLYGRQGLAPANRLQLLNQSGTNVAPLSHGTEQPKLLDCKSGDSPQNIYQIPSVPRPSSGPAYEHMDRIYKVPSTPLSASKSHIPAALKHNTEETEGSKLSMFSVLSSPKGEVYDVPNQTRRTLLFTAPKTSRQPIRKASLVPISELERRFESQEGLKCSSPSDTYVYAVPPPLSQDPSYDIPVPSATETQQRMVSGFNTLPNPRKPEWIYDVPVSPEKANLAPGSYGTMPSKAVGRQVYDTLPVRGWPENSCSPTFSLYDIPKPLDVHSPPTILPRAPGYEKLSTQRFSEDQVYAVPPQEHPSTGALSGPHRDHIPLECRGDSSNTYEHTRARLQRIRKVLMPASLHDRPGNGDSLLQEDDEKGRVLRFSTADNQRISTASSSSTSSCDSLALSSSSPEPLREVTLSQEEASRTLLELQDTVCKAVPPLMEFVSSSWRSKEHLEKHLEEIKEAAEGVACSVTSFLNFTLDVKGNARRLTDANLQTRLHKQLSIVEDSGIILQQTVGALNMAGWPLSTLSQDPGQVQTPDQLERFVMVARTVPEDVKRLVSILNANGKLLFRPNQRESELTNTKGQTDMKKNPDPDESEQGSELMEDDNDYVQLQTKTDFEKQQKIVQKEPKDVISSSKTPKVEQKRHSSEPQVGTDGVRKPSRAEHCRLYFGALQKAIGGFVSSLQDGQPPEKFISHSKLVIMVGQRLVDTLFREAHDRGSSQNLLCKSNHLCALLKQLAVATKKAALHFPDKQPLLEAQDFAKELAQRAQHFRISLDF
ncbi:cas scaffolding protein family member 4 [Lampris incognitus]|uniref:cas scaffolding protein family member 4 n=1 Tax=Lampris incognitus TaxID=2546036 RepID=UPI0024B545E2|nr:cas scaffolding protein family member 4 [Lampris incognitus]